VATIRDDYDRGWFAPGDICMVIPVRDGINRGWGGQCVPPEVFDRAGVGGSPPSVTETLERVAYLHWGPVGDRFSITERPPIVDSGTRFDRGD
jgi:hypothetical protein